MPFDVREFAGAAPADWGTVSRSRRLVAIWLFGICGMILIMVILGGITRLTGSGLSIMEWAPIRGVLPPLNHAQWEKLFALYQTIPQYRLLHSGFGLDEFRQLFWFEWVHRLWGRLIGVTFFVPLVWFWVSGRIDARLRGGLLLIFLIGGLQGAVGWFMVASGFLPDTIAVAPYRLAIHLALALALYTAVLWCALGLIRPVPVAAPNGALLRWLLQALCVLVVLTIVAGSFVAGTHAGFEYNTFPLMEGRLVPANYARAEPFLSNLFNNPAAVQFDHRLLATLTFGMAGVSAAIGCSRRVPRPTRIAVVVLGAFVMLQYALGVATLLLVVPIPLAVAHQANAVLVLTAAVVALHGLRQTYDTRLVRLRSRPTDGR